MKSKEANYTMQTSLLLWAANKAVSDLSSFYRTILEDEITELLNSVIQNPDLAGKEYISPKSETPIEVKRMENEIERALGQIDFDMSCVWLDYMVKYFQCKNCVGSSPKTKKCVASFLVPVYRLSLDAIRVLGSVFI